MSEGKPTANPAAPAKPAATPTASGKKTLADYQYDGEKLEGTLTELGLFFSEAISITNNKASLTPAFEDVATYNKYKASADSLRTFIYEAVIQDRRNNWTPTQQIYYKIRELFPGNKSQYFSLSFPTQPLNRYDFAYDTSIGNTQINKPISVVEKEFLLADSVIPMAPIVGGSTGESLSNSYVRALNNFVPKFDVESKLSGAQRTIQEFLTNPRPTKQGVSSTLATQQFLAESGDTSLIEYSAKRQSTDLVTASKDATTKSEDAVDIPIERFEKTTQAYADLKQDILLKRWTALNQIDPRQPRQMEDYLRKLSYTSEAENFQLESRYLVAVMKGRYHLVRNLASYLDIMTIGEQLLETKAAARNSRTMMVDQSGYKYPTNFTPSNWADHLRSDFLPEDLRADPDVIATQLTAATNVLTKLLTEQESLAALDTKPNYQELKQAVNKARAAQAESMDNLMNSYTDSVVGLVKTYLAYQSGGLTMVGEAALGGAKQEIEDAAKKEGANKKLNPEPVMNLVNELATSYKAVGAATTKLQEAGANLVEELRNRAAQTTGDLAQQLIRIKNQIADQQAQVDALKAKLAAAGNQRYQKAAGDNSNTPKYDVKLDAVSVARATLEKSSGYTNLVNEFKIEEKETAVGEKAKAVEAIADKSSAAYKAAETDLSTAQSALSKARLDFQSKEKELPEYKNWEKINLASVVPSGIDPVSPWTSVVVTQKTSLAQSQSSSSSSASQTSWKVNFFIGSASGNQSSEQSKSALYSSEKTLDITIAFQCLKVEINRPGWFAPELLRQSDQFNNISSKLKFNKQTLPNILSQPPILNIDEVKGEQTNAGLMPVYPTALLLCKDVVITIAGDQSTRDSIKDHAASASSVSAGCFGFSFNKSSSNQSDSEKVNVVSDAKSTTIKIPGPQILGYIMQKTELDQSTEITNVEPVPATVFY